MTYGSVCEGVFLARPNRFVALVELGGREELVHVKNTGRCEELLVPGARVYLSRAEGGSRRTRYDLVAVWKGERLINMDSQAPNRAFLEYLRAGRHIGGITRLRPETTYGGSRFDFYVEAGERKIFIEVKGVTLEREGAALFPDAPTLRGVKHLGELSRCAHGGFEAQMAFVIQMDNVRSFAPNNAVQPAFGAALTAAAAAGVKLFALDCAVTPDSMTIGNPVPVIL